MIVQTIEQFSSAVPTAAGISNFADVQPFVRSAELWLKNQVLGADLYDVINTESTSVNDELIELCASVISNHAYWDAIPFLDLVHTDQGFAVISAANKVPASKERVERLRESCLKRRDSEVEALIAWLEAHTEYHDDWKGSPAYSILSNCLIRSATELALYAQWDGDRRAFVLLKPKLLQETMLHMESVFSKDYIEELTEKQNDGDLTSDDRKVIELLKYSLGSLVTDNRPAAEKIAADALRYMDAHIESFETYAASGEYAARNAAGYENAADATIFSSLF